MKYIRDYLVPAGQALVCMPLIFLGSAQADTTYDGIYQWSPGNFLSLHQDGTQMIATIYFTNDGNFSFSTQSGSGVLPVPQLDLFDLMSGSVIGSTAQIEGTRFHRACNVTYDFKFNLDSSITATRVGVSNTSMADSAGISCASIVASEATTITVPKIRFNPVTVAGPVYEKEYNDELGYATTFKVGDTIIGNLSGVADVDWFQVSIATGGMVNATFDASSMNYGMFSVYWYGPDMTVMSGRNIGGGVGTPVDQMKLTYSFPAFQTGIYKVRVQPTFSSLYNGGEYKINVIPVP